MDRLVVVGGNAAGMSGASKAKRILPDIEVIVVEKGSYISYGACGIPYFFEGLVKSPESLLNFTPESAKSERDLECFINHRVTEILPGKKSVIVENLKTQDIKEIPYSKLLISTGAKPVIPKIFTEYANNQFVLRNLQDMIKFKSFLENNNCRKIVIIGLSYIALEMAEALSLRGIEVTLLGRSGIFLRDLHPSLSLLLENSLKANGVKFILKSQIKEVVRKDSLINKISFDDGDIFCDAVILATGIKPEIELAKNAGISIGQCGAIKVSERMETNIPSIYAAGDCTEITDLVTGKPAWIPLGTTANKGGRIAGENIAGLKARFPGVVGTNIVKIFDIGIAKTGLSLEDAEKNGFKAIWTYISENTQSGYLPSSSEMHIGLVVDSKSRKILGSQMLGIYNSVWRINVIALALQEGLKVDNLSTLDMAYAPPFAPVWDPVLVASNNAKKGLK